MNDLRIRMKARLDEARYEHTLGVAYTAACLARLYEVNVNKALRAGMLHDCAKCFNSEEIFFYCEKYGVTVSEVEKRNPTALLHAKVGAKLAADEYGERDQDILNAIEYHTTGRPEMSMLEKIVFVADYIEPGRDKAPNLYEIRKLAFCDINKALVKILEDTLKYLTCKGAETDPATIKTLEYYIR